MTPLHSETGRTGNTRVDLRATREPAPTHRNRMHRFAARGFTLCRRLGTPGGEVAALLFHALADALADASIADRECARAVQAVAERDATIAQLRENLEDARAAYYALLAQHGEGFEEITKEGEEDFHVETTVRRPKP